MYCEQCGQEIKEGQRFCTRCGYSIKINLDQYDVINAQNKAKHVKKENQGK